MRGFLLLAGACLAACSSPSSSGSAVQVLRAVCAPITTRAGAAFTFTVTGGCTGAQGDYRCVVNTGTDALEVTLLGPEACAGCACTVFEVPCAVAPLDEGRWQMSFMENASFDRVVEVTAAAPVFSCDPPDGGIPDGG